MNQVRTCKSDILVVDPVPALAADGLRPGVSAAPQLFARRETGNDPSSSEKYNPALCLLFGRPLSGDLAAEIE